MATSCLLMIGFVLSGKVQPQGVACRPCGEAHASWAWLHPNSRLVVYCALAGVVCNPLPAGRHVLVELGCTPALLVWLGLCLRPHLPAARVGALFCWQGWCAPSAR